MTERQKYIDNLQKILTAEDIMNAFLRYNPLDWRVKYDCQIIPNWLPKYPRPDTLPKVVVKCGDVFLRWSAGPVQGFFWDIYGDDFTEVGLAFRAMIEAPFPSNLQITKE